MQPSTKHKQWLKKTATQPVPNCFKFAKCVKLKGEFPKHHPGNRSGTWRPGRRRHRAPKPSSNKPAVEFLGRKNGDFFHLGRVGKTNLHLKSPCFCLIAVFQRDTPSTHCQQLSMVPFLAADLKTATPSSTVPIQYHHFTESVP